MRRPPARHWHDLAAIARSSHFARAASNRAVAKAVAQHKSLFFVEKEMDGGFIAYTLAAAGHLKIVPEGGTRSALACLREHAC